MSDETAVEIELWPDAEPGTGSPESTFTDAELRVRNVSRPTLTPYLPDPATAKGTGVVVAPGGGFRMLSWESEGTRVASWLQARGIASFLLKYRIVDTGPTMEDFDRHNGVVQMIILSGEPVARVAEGIGPQAIEDAHRALSIVREHGSLWHVRPDRVGFLGFSAGGYLAAAVATAVEKEDRPDFVAPIYPALPRPLDVPADGPPLFSAVASNDPICLHDTIELYEAWHAADLSCELHAYASGGHGFGLSGAGASTDSWIERFHEWLRGQALA